MLCVNKLNYFLESTTLTPPLATNLSRATSFETPVQAVLQTPISSQPSRPTTPDTPPFGDSPPLGEPKTIQEVYQRTFATPNFSSTRMPNKRRTIFEMSKEIIEHRVRSINLASARKNRSMSESDLTAEMEEPPATMKTADPICTASSPQLNKTGGISHHIHKEMSTLDQPMVQRKRKLFAQSDSLNLDVESPTGIEALIESSVSKRPKPTGSTKPTVSNRTATAKPTVAKKATTTIRRRTTMDFATNNKTKIASTGGQLPRLEKFLVSTNMHREQIAVIQEVGR